MESSFLQLAELIDTNDLFNKDHCEMLYTLVYSLSLDGVDNITDINSMFINQVELETIVVFLVGYYNNKLAKHNVISDYTYANTLLDVPEKPNNSLRKYTVDEKKSLTKLNRDVHRNELTKALLSELVKTLESLQRIVFYRNKKLENLTINYRREVESDSNI